MHIMGETNINAVISSQSQSFPYCRAGKIARDMQSRRPAPDITANGLINSPPESKAPLSVRCRVFHPQLTLQSINVDDVSVSLGRPPLGFARATVTEKPRICSIRRPCRVQPEDTRQSSTT